MLFNEAPGETWAHSSLTSLESGQGFPCVDKSKLLCVFQHRQTKGQAGMESTLLISCLGRFPHQPEAKYTEGQVIQALSRYRDVLCFCKSGKLTHRDPQPCLVVTIQSM